MKIFSCTLALSMLAVSAYAASSENTQIDGVLIARDDVVIKSSVDGIVRTVHFQDGDVVEIENTIVELDDDEQAAKVAVANAAANATADTAAAKVLLDQTQRKYRDLAQAQKNGAATKWEVMDAKSARDEAHANHEQTLERIKLDTNRLALERAALSRYSFRAPFNGEVVDVAVSPGESISRGDTIARVVNTRSLEIETFVAAETFTILEEGKTYLGQVEKPFDQKFSAMLKHIDPVFEAATGSVRVVFAVNNDGTLPVGAPVVLDLTPPTLMTLETENGTPSFDMSNPHLER